MLWRSFVGPSPALRPGKKPTDGGTALLLALAQEWMAVPICLRLFADTDRPAASRTLAIAGSIRASAISTTARTTSSDIAEKARRRTPERRRVRMTTAPFERHTVMGTAPFALRRKWRMCGRSLLYAER